MFSGGTFESKAGFQLELLLEKELQILKSLFGF